MVAAAEQDYHAMRKSLAIAVQGARLLGVAGLSQFEVFTHVYWMLSRSDPRATAALGAVAIVQQSQQPEHRRVTS
jgi:hypothetical protein